MTIKWNTHFSCISLSMDRLPYVMLYWLVTYCIYKFVPIVQSTANRCALWIDKMEYIKPIEIHWRWMFSSVTSLITVPRTLSYMHTEGFVMTIQCCILGHGQGFEFKNRHLTDLRVILLCVPYADTMPHDLWTCPKCFNVNHNKISTCR